MLLYMVRIDLVRKTSITTNKRERRLKKETVINRLTSFNSYFVNFDLLDKDENLFNGNPSMILGCFDIVGKPFERVDYSPKESAMRKITRGK